MIGMSENQTYDKDKGDVLMGYFLGLDISLTSTGYSVVKGGKAVYEGSIKTASDEEWVSRITKILKEINYILDTFPPKYVFIENYSYGSIFGRELLGEIHGVVMYLLLQRGVPFEKVPPTQVKLFGCGRGNNPPCPPGRAKTTWSKTWVVETVNTNYNRDFRLADNDICDAFIIALLAEQVYLAKNDQVNISELPIHYKKVLSEILYPTPKTKKKKSRGKKHDTSSK